MEELTVSVSLHPHVYGWLDLAIGPQGPVHLVATLNPNEYDWVTDQLPGIALVASSAFWVKRHFPNWVLTHWHA